MPGSAANGEERTLTDGRSIARKVLAEEKVMVGAFSDDNRLPGNCFVLDYYFKYVIQLLLLQDLIIRSSYWCIGDIHMV